MRDKTFENIFTGWHGGTLKAERGIDTKKVGFLYRDDSVAVRAGLFFYSKNKLDLQKVLADLIYKAQNHVIKLSDDTRYIKVGTLKEKNKEVIFYVCCNDIFKLDYKNEPVLINDIEPLYLMYPLTEVYLYRLPAKIIRCPL